VSQLKYWTHHDDYVRFAKYNRSSVTALKPATGRLGGRRSTLALLIASAHLEPLLGAVGELTVEFVAGVLAVDEVAEATTNATLARVKTAAGLAEVGDGAQLAVNGASGVPAVVELIAGGLGGLFVLKAGIDVANQMVIVVVANDKLLELAIFAELAPNILVEGVEVVLELRRVHAVLRVVGRVLVQVGHEDGLTVRRLDVLSRATVSVTAGTDFKVERAVDLVKLGAENRSQKVSHVGLSRVERGELADLEEGRGELWFEIGMEIAWVRRLR
jgi:hypothetical protein